ncbi:unnamed protein product [Blepharisma stoltei]|uniref:Uncharacterized protein n=1 Tax=Blepharisma stoltei TaxID=1481888 RepID=A0AAU9JIZ7_9CILI|nr:unnamed protein product [Blepharisma stoltei]
MEGNDKEFRHSFSLPVFSYREKEGRSIYSINVPKLMFWFSGLMIGMVYGNLILACATNFSCFTFLPTLGYLGCFRGHDRVFIVSCTYFALVLILMYTGAYYHFGSSLPRWKRHLLLYLGVISCSILPIISLVDEVNSVHILPLEFIYVFLSTCFIISNLAWSSLVYSLLLLSKSTFNAQERHWFFILSVFLGVFVFISIINIVEWNWAYSIPSNLLINENAEAICEWILVSISIMVPPIFCQFFRGFLLTFTVNSGKSKENEKSNEDIELAAFDA